MGENTVDIFMLEANKILTKEMKLDHQPPLFFLLIRGVYLEKHFLK